MSIYMNWLRIDLRSVKWASRGRFRSLWGDIIIPNNDTQVQLLCAEDCFMGTSRELLSRGGERSSGLYRLGHSKESWSAKTSWLTVVFYMKNQNNKLREAYVTHGKVNIFVMQ